MNDKTPKFVQLGLPLYLEGIECAGGPKIPINKSKMALAPRDRADYMEIIEHALAAIKANPSLYGPRVQEEAQNITNYLKRDAGISRGEDDSMLRTYLFSLAVESDHYDYSHVYPKDIREYHTLVNPANNIADSIVAFSEHAITYFKMNEYFMTSSIGNVADVAAFLGLAFSRHSRHYASLGTKLPHSLRVLYEFRNKFFYSPKDSVAYVRGKWLNIEGLYPADEEGNCILQCDGSYYMAIFDMTTGVCHIAGTDYVFTCGMRGAPAFFESLPASLNTTSDILEVLKRALLKAIIVNQLPTQYSCEEEPLIVPDSGPKDEISEWLWRFVDMPIRRLVCYKNIPPCGLSDMCLWDEHYEAILMLAQFHGISIKGGVPEAYDMLDELLLK